MDEKGRSRGQARTLNPVSLDYQTAKHRFRRSCADNLLSRSFFFLCSFFLNEDSSLKVSADDLETAWYFFKKINRSFVCNVAPVSVFGVFRSATDHADYFSLIHTGAAIRRHAHEDTSPLKFIRQTLQFLKSNQASNRGFSASSFWEVVSLSPLVLAPPPETLELCVGVRVSPRHAVLKELLRWTSKMSPAATNKLSSTN